MVNTPLAAEPMQNRRFLEAVPKRTKESSHANPCTFLALSMAADAQVSGPPLGRYTRERVMPAVS